MSPTENGPAPVALTDFFSRLVADVFEGAKLAAKLQEEQLLELENLVRMTDRDFAQTGVSDQELVQELSSLFPALGSERPHGIYVGAPYHLATERSGESPAFVRLLGLALLRSDYVQARGTGTLSLTRQGVEKIMLATRELMGRRSKHLLKSMLARGAIPRVLVDSGTISAKMTVTIEPKKRASQSGRLDSREAFRLLVRMVDERAPQYQKLQVDVLSELQITFKTVT